MGLVLDSSVLIGAEREKRPVSQLLSLIESTYSETLFVSLFHNHVMELEHGWHRANNADHAQRRRRYLDEILSIIPVESFTPEMDARSPERSRPK